MVEYKVDDGAIKLKTAHGTLIVTAFDDPDYPAFNIDFKLEGHENEPPVPVAMIEDASEEMKTSETNGHAVVVRVYGNVNMDEYTDRVDISLKEIKKAYEEFCNND